MSSLELVKSYKLLKGLRNNDNYKEGNTRDDADDDDKTL